MNKWLLKNEWLLKPLLRFDTHFFKVCNISIFEVWDIIRPKRDREGRMKLLFYLIGTLTTFITLGGMLLGYMRAYFRYDLPQGRPPMLAPLSRHTKAGLVIGGIMIWILIFLVLMVGITLVTHDVVSTNVLLTYLAVNGLGMFIIMATFNAKRYKIARHHAESMKHGSARIGVAEDVKEYLGLSKGIYFGGGLRFNDKGHLLSIAGTRGGKGTNLIIPNLLDVQKYDGSWVVIDPKGEAAAVCAGFQEVMGKKVYVLNPWDLLSANIPSASSYNPFDLLTDRNSPHLIDDAQVIAEMLVPINPKEHEKFFTDSARSIVAGFIAYIAFAYEKWEQNLNTLYQIIRHTDLDSLLADMYACNIEGGNGTIISVIAQEIKSVMKSGDKTWGIVLTTMLQATDFIKSPALQESLDSGFNPALLREGNTVLYVIIPADKISSHSRWLRLVVMTLIRSIVRNPVKDKQVTFILDEFAALGYLSEIETALGTYAGYGVTIWPILQSLIQLKNIYGDGWENFIANATVRTFFSINDNFSAKYLSEAMGTMTHVLTKPKKKSGSNNGAQDDDEYDTNARPLMAPDEVRRASGENFITFVGDKPPLMYPKAPYYTRPEYHPNGRALYDTNPYIS